MVCGEKHVLKPLEKFLKSLAVENDYLHTEKTGSGHFCKMIHNEIEYGMMQAIAEGYELLEHSEFNYDLEKVSLM
ncbi:6-phosphogluconate dehydrogenase, decarboxylating [Mycoplasma putrefaciens]|uniref:hypothetical protein n=1 Tax=Mycoplasma putrefaciens TaxID=2123 RepID=UPI00031E8D01|nr:6-phosphogluconate dehydrogenase, decarboxylating [Mycoplasma putrefaciens]